MKVLFMGTPDIAAEALRALAESGECGLVGAVTQPDRPKGRGMKMIPPPVKLYAEKIGIPVFQPSTLKDGAFESELAKLSPDLIIVAAYGRILPKYVLEYPRYGCVCAHASLLPKYRGAAPINRAVMAGERLTGITAIYMDEGIDTGDMIMKIEVPIGENDCAGDVHDRLADAAGMAMVETVRMIKAGAVTRTKQPSEGATYAQKLTREDGKLNFSDTAEDLHNRIRGLAPAPCAWTRTPDGKLLKIAEARVSDARSGSDCEAGTVKSLDGGSITVLCGGGSLLSITKVIPEGKGRMDAADYIRGRKIAAGDKLG